MCVSEAYVSRDFQIRLVPDRTHYGPCFLETRGSSNYSLRVEPRFIGRIVFVHSGPPREALSLHRAVGERNFVVVDCGVASPGVTPDTQVGIVHDAVIRLNVESWLLAFAC